LILCIAREMTNLTSCLSKPPNFTHAICWNHDEN